MELDWDGLRADALPPRLMSPPVQGRALNVESFQAGLHAVGLIGRRQAIKPQQVLVADMLDQNHRFSALVMPRRSAKTTTIFAWALGRCFTRHDYLVAYTMATSGKKARDRFIKDMVPLLERIWPDPASRPFRIWRSAGTERLVFDNGSIFQILRPHSDDFRSDAWDLIIIDEAGEADPQMGEEVLAAALPTQDTRPDAQLVLAGTAGAYRKGNLLWDGLQDGREGLGGILEYGERDTLVADDVESWEQVLPMLEACHPGLGTLTTAEALALNFRKLPRDLFLREYLGVFGMAGEATGVFNPVNWQSAEMKVKTLPSPPERFALAMSAAPNQSAASICAAWRERDGTARILLLDHRVGVRWLAERGAYLSRKYHTPMVHDSMGVILVHAEEMNRMSPRPRMTPLNTRQITTAAAKLVEAIDTGRARHFGQEELTRAALLAKRRTIGVSAWGFGRRTADDDISPIEAAGMALRAFDEMPTRGAVRILRPTA
jgi:hypothetical protein